MQPQEPPRGHVLGILATKGVNRPATPNDPFPGRTATFRDISRIGREKGLYVCVFGPRNIDRVHKRVNAYFYVPGKGWTKHSIPLPQVVYNRVANRWVEGRPRVQKVLHWFKSEGVTVFNPNFLDKWEVYACLQADERVRPFVPETILYSKTEQLVKCLKEWGLVYCKPRRGSLGTGISALRLTATGSVLVMRNGAAVGTRVEHLANLESVRRWALRMLKPGRICLQRGITMSVAHGRRFDIRALVQKDEAGQWRFTGAAARAAAKGQLTTHVPRGGVRMSLEQALLSALHDKKQIEAVKTELTTLSETAAVCLEEDLRDEYGEFSLDVGVDRHGHLWIFEMNAKPFRFDEPEIRKKAYRRLIGFSKYLVTQETPFDKDQK